MGCPLDGDDISKNGNKCYALGQGGLCGILIQTSTKFTRKALRK